MGWWPFLFCSPESIGDSIYRGSGENILEEENM
jgi:hypothetical protein